MEAEPYSLRDRRFWQLSFGLMLASVFVFSNLYVIQPILPLLAKQFNVSATESSLLFSVASFSLMISLLAFGFISDRIGRLGILKWTLVLSSIPLFLMPMVESFYTLVLLRLFVGIFSAGLPAVAVAYITEEVAPNSRGLAVTIYIASNALGGMAGRVFGGFWADAYTWESSFYVLGVFGLIISALCVMVLPKSQYFVSSKQPYSQDLKGMFIHLKNPMLIYAFIFGMMIQVSFSGIWVYLPFYLEGDPFYLSIQVISLLFLTYSMGVIGSPIAGKLADLYGTVRILFSGLIIMALGVLMTAIPNVVVIILGLAVMCLGFFTAHSLTSSWVGATAEHHKSGASSIYLFSYYIGVTVGGTGVGVIWTSMGWNGVILVSVTLPLISGWLFYRKIH
ncbi:MFS transporter [Piscibacillus halophilus]|uniref:MFS transporter n=1 Tax=Piscibacillus halophilus TaxID=571933 RepID=UPI00158C3A37|nr:MFS transporter [Piscibacillus halophilus]